jgi:hypothetical protein
VRSQVQLGNEVCDRRNEIGLVAPRTKQKYHYGKEKKKNEENRKKVQSVEIGYGGTGQHPEKNNRQGQCLFFDLHG